MLFISTEFIVFFGTFALLYFLAPRRFRMPLLLVASLVFYGYSYPPYVLLLLGATVVDYGIARAIGASDSPKARERLLALSLALNVGLLLLFKYAGFLNESLADLLGVLSVGYQPDGVSLLVPLGISFITFTKIAYVVDVYRQQIPPEKNVVTFAAFVSFFPNVISGPIERAGHLIPQLEAPVRFDDARVVDGLRLILWGAFKKIVIADHLALYVNQVYDSAPAYQGLTLITATLFLAFQIYADFSGYTDMARGIARILGVNLFENFRQPYLAKSILEFWRRWHISLTTWIREYLFFPLSRFLLRKMRRRYPRVIEVGVYLTVMALIGLWHGASWTFVIWGLLHGLYMGVNALVDARRIRLLPRGRWADSLKAAGIFLLVTFAWIFFRANSMTDAAHIVHRLFDFGGDFLASFQIYTSNPDAYAAQLVVCLALIAVLLGADWFDARRGLFAVFTTRSAAVRWAVYYALAALIILSLIPVDVVQQFVYFKF